MFTIKQHEPEGWEKAFQVYFAGKAVPHMAFRYRDSANAWVINQFA